MFECLIIGDSVGVGTAQQINARYAGRCDVVAMERATLQQILAWRIPAKAYSICIFAMGSNDTANAALVAKLTKLRQSMRSRRVIWLLPYSRPHAYLVNSVALSFRDESIDLARFQTKDGIHPFRYRDVAGLLERPCHRGSNPMPC